MKFCADHGLTLTWQWPESDVKESSYYYKATLWAEQEGIVNGTTETTFEPDENVTREQLVTILFRYTKIDGDFAARADIFKDVADIYGYAKNAVGWAVQNSIVDGYPDGTFMPKGNATRAEATKILAIMAMLVK